MIEGNVHENILTEAMSMNNLRRDQYVATTHFKFPSVRDSADCVSSGRLREVKNN